MNNEVPTELDTLIHNVRNPLNSISLHAELGKMLIDERASIEQIKQAFDTILEQCKCCEQLITQIRQETAVNK